MSESGGKKGRFARVKNFYIILFYAAVFYDKITEKAVLRLFEEGRDRQGGNSMILVNTDRIEGCRVRMLGLVKGSTIQSKNVVRDLGSGLKTLVGGELKAYTEMMNEARDIATNRMIEDASLLGADGIVGVRYATSAIMQGAAEVMAYGTAVKILGDE